MCIGTSHRPATAAAIVVKPWEKYNNRVIRRLRITAIAAQSSRRPTKTTARGGRRYRLLGALTNGVTRHIVSRRFNKPLRTALRSVYIIMCSVFVYTYLPRLSADTVSLALHRYPSKSPPVLSCHAVSPLHPVCVLSAQIAGIRATTRFLPRSKPLLSEPHTIESPSRRSQ